MTHQSKLRLVQAVISYILIFSLLASPAYPTRRVSAASLTEPAAQGLTASVTLTKSDSLQVDQNGDGLVGAGDTLRYTLTLSNTGTVAANEVLLQDILEQNLDLVPGSLRTTPLAFDQSLHTYEDSAPLSFELEGADFDGDLLSYEILSGPTHGAINGTPPYLTYQPNVANYFGSDSLQFQVCDAPTGGNCDTAIVQITIHPVNDEPTFSAGSSPVSVLEDSGDYFAPWAADITPGPVNETGQTVQFTVTNNNNSLFSTQPAISPTGTLSFTPAANQYGQATLTVTLQDNGGTANGGDDTSSEQTFTVQVQPVNDAPSFAGSGSVTVLEDAGAQTRENWASAITPGPNESAQTVQFVVTGNTNPGLFQLLPAVSSDGTLTFQSAPDMVGAADVTLVLQDDGGTASGGSDTSAPYVLRITVQENNDPPLVSPATFYLDENSPVDTTVGTAISYTDPDTGQTHAYAITLGNTDNAFAIDPATGLIRVATPAAVNFEVNSIFYLTVTVTDSATPPGVGSAIVTIHLNDLNDAPVVSPATFTLAENSALHTVVGKVLVSDDEELQTHSWAITNGDDAGVFAIDANGQITVAIPSALNFETTPSFTLTVRATDNGSSPASGSAIVKVNLSDVNEAPVVNDASFDVDEYSPNGTLVGALIFSDPDSSQSHTVEITGAGNIDGAFAVNDLGEIRVANEDALDFAVHSSFTFTVQVTDNSASPLSDTATVTIDINNINDTPEVDAASFQLNENSAVNTVLGTLTFDDRDPDQTHTFSIENGNESGAFALNPTSGVLSVAGALDYETLSSYTLEVAVTDNGEPPATGTATIQIAILNVNEEPVVADQTFGVPENSSIGTAVGTVVVTDPETAQTHTFTILTGNTGDAFVIGTTSGAITVATPAALNFEGQQTFTLEIEVKDSGTPQEVTTGTITINLSDVNETPVISDATFTLDENTQNGTVVGQVLLNDPDAEQTHTFSIPTGNTGGAFAISNTGSITVANASALDYEARTSFTLDVSVLDNGSPSLSDSAVVTVNLNDINEAPVVTGESYDTIGNTSLIVAASTTETAPHIFVNGNLLSNDSDPDAGDTFTCSLNAASPGAQVTINAGGQFTYLPPAGATTDSFTYKVTDSKGLSTIGTVTITMKGMVWYVDNAEGSPTGMGRSADPFATLQQAQDASSAGHTIYVYYGTGDTTRQSSGISLKANQRLIGAGVALEMPVSVNGSASPITLLSAGQKPWIDNLFLGGNGVSITAGPAEVRGLNIAGAINAIDVTYSGSAGPVLIQDNIIRSAGAEGVDINLGTTVNLTARVLNNTITATGNGFDLLTTAGTANVEFSNNTVTSGANGVWINRSAGAVSINAFANNTISGLTTGTGVSIQSATFDAVPGGGVDAVNLGYLLVGTPGDSVGGSGVVITNAGGNLTFSELKVYAQGPFGLQATGLSGYFDGRFSLTIPDGQGIAHAGAGTAISLADLFVTAPNMDIRSSNSTGDGAKFFQVNGSFTSSISSFIQSSTGIAFLVNGGEANLTYNGTITQTVGRTVQVTNRTKGSVIFTGLVNGGGTGVSLNSNAIASTVTFSGGLTLSTLTNDAFTVTSGGTVNVTGTQNTIVTTTGAAVNMTGASTVIGGNGVTFRRIDVNGAGRGINLDGLGGTGAFQVTGDGSAGSGGEIKNTSGSGVRLNNVSNITLTDMKINTVATSNPATGPNCGPEAATECLAAISMVNATNVVIDGLSASVSGQMGISASGGGGLTVTDSTIANAGNGNDEFALLLVNPAGTVAILNSTFTGMAEGGIRLYKNQGNLLNLTLRGSTLSTNGTTYGEDGFQFKLASSAIANMLVDNTSFTNLQRDGIDGVFQDSSQLSLTVQGSRFTTNYGAGGILIAGNNTAVGRLNISSNTITNTVSTPIALTSATNATLDATIAGNTISNPSPPSPQIGEGIRLRQQDNSTMTVKVDGNTISGVNIRNLSAYATLPASNGSLHATVQNNNFQTPTLPLSMGMEFYTLDANHTMCLDIHGNTSAGNGEAGIDVGNQPGATFQVVGVPVGPATAAAVAAYIKANNASTLDPFAFGDFLGWSGACRSVTSPYLPPVVMSQPLPVVQSGSHGGILAKVVNQTPSETVQVDIGTLPVGKSVTVTFDVLIANPLPTGVFQVANQASVSGENFVPLWSDDPATAAQLGDATVTLLYNIPTAADDTYTINEDGAVNLAAPGVLSNDQAASGFTLSATVESAPTSGAVNLAADGGMLYTPVANSNGDQTFTYRASDGTNTSAPALVTIHVLPVNDAPVLDSSGDMQLNPIGMNNYDNPGTLVRDLLSSAGSRISDVDENALVGIAVTAADTTHGAWEYSTTGGLTWEALGAVSHLTARLLASDADTRLRFVPAEGTFGEIDPAITFRAWDRTAGSNGEMADVTTNGGITPYSAATETASLEVIPTTDLVMNKTVSESQTLAGNQVVYSLEVTNQGLSDALNVTVTDALPAGVNLISSSAGCSETSGVVTCVAASLAPDATVTFDLTVGLATELIGTITNTASVENDRDDIDLSNNADSVEVVTSRSAVVLDPDAPIDPDQWSDSPITQPACGSSFLGEFGNDTVTLTLSDLPQHTEVIVEFDLLLIRSWDGNLKGNSWIPSDMDEASPLETAEIGPDQWNLRVAGQQQINTTFSNWDLVGFKQAYPGNYPGGDYQARTGAIANNSLCYEQDSTYRLAFTVAHSGSDLTVDFSALGLQGIENESWGLDNVRVTVASGANQKPYQIFLPVTVR